MMKCDPKAFAKCPTRHLCGTPEDATFADGSECDKFNQKILHQPMTNADMIRKMNDDTLAAWISHITISGVRPWCNFHCRTDGECGCKKCISKWLQQPVDYASQRGGHISFEE